MLRFLGAYFLVFLCLSSPFFAWSQLLPEEDLVEKGEELLELERSLFFRADDVRMDMKKSVVEAKGNVRVEGQGVKLLSRSMEYDLETRKMRLRGNVTFEVAGYGHFTSEEVNLDFGNNRAVTEAVYGLFWEYHKFAAASAEIDIDDKEAKIQRGVYTFCPVCTLEERKEGGTFPPKPIWQLKVGQILQSDEGRYIILKNISMEIFTVGLPLLFFPELQLLSPEVERQGGFLFFTGGVGAQGFFMGFPFFIDLGEDVNVVLTPYLGAGHSLLGVHYEQLGRSWRVRMDNLLKPRTGALRDISEREIGRWGSRGYHEYDLDKRWRLRSEWDVVSDTEFGFDYSRIHRRGVSRRSPSYGESRVEFFDSKSYGELSLGFADNLYGDTPLYDKFWGGRWSRTRSGGEGVRWLESLRLFSVGESYERENWEKVEPVEVSSGGRTTSGWQGVNVGIEREQRKLLPWGMELSSGTGLHGFLREEGGSVYDGISFRSSHGWSRAKFEEVEDWRATWLEFRTRAIVRWPWIRSGLLDETWQVTPFGGLTYGSNILGEGRRGEREEWYLPHRSIFEKASRSPSIEGMDSRGLRAVAGGEFLIRGGKRAESFSFYGGMSTHVLGNEYPEGTPERSLDGNMVFGGGQLLLNQNRILTYDMIRDVEKNRSVKEQLGLRLYMDSGPRFNFGYTHVRGVDDEFSLSIVEGKVKSWITEEIEIEGEIERDVSGKDYYYYDFGVNYVIPCFKVGILWYTKLKTSLADLKREPSSGVFFNVNIFTDQAYSRWSR
jgi:hypothetical protein